MSHKSKPFLLITLPHLFNKTFSSNIGTTSSNTSRRQPSRIPQAIPSPNRSRPTTPSLSRPPSSGSRPVTPLFSQSAETINIYINYNEPDQE
ncbi:13213_t:CDS:2 [Funneliformis mosseae]|uniref:13213_t:CDS:1 n=1 Tax=Funneliformis mosseae TaxID=27381 RepID=A0A9N8ZHR6_FUNMO|nr:13213_t:CDS:2 [Funneliformis mosseae]